MIEKILERLRKLLSNVNFEKATQEVNESYFDGMAYAYGDAIKIMQKAAKDGGWIHCSERLPNWNEYQKNDGRFIVTDGNRVYQSIFDIYANGGFRTLKLFHFVGGTQTASFEVDNCVIAWQPLPAPCQKGE